MPVLGYTGISYPFRINGRGGVTTSTTNKLAVPHIEESIKQILGTQFLERVMEADIYSEVDASLFEPNDESLQQVIKNQIVSALEILNDKIELTEDDIELTVSDSGESLIASINFKVIKYQEYYATVVKVGDLSE